jgi:hypothetical protein
MATKKTGAPDRGYISVAKHKFLLNEGALSELKLTPHDINVISVVARNRSLDEKELLRLVKESQPSRNAMDIVNIILKIDHKILSASSKDENGATKKAIAKNYLTWASYLESPHQVMGHVHKSEKGPSGKKLSKKKNRS